MQKRNWYLIIVIISILCIMEFGGIYYFYHQKNNSLNTVTKYNVSKENKEGEKKQEYLPENIEEVTTFKPTINIEPVITNQVYQESILNGAYPELDKNMIPVVYRDNEWQTADIYENWYSYADLKWANVVYVKPELTSYYQKLPSHTPLNFTDILAFFVWVPRYEYKLFNVNNKPIPAQMIEINFVNKETPKKTELQNGLFYTHPAFSKTNQELNGFWIAKFEPSLSEEGTVQILPTKKTLVNINTAQMWDYAQSCQKSYSSSYSSRMITNMEWGAIAYLSYSKYSKLSNSDYKGKNKEIFVNNAMGKSLNEWTNVTTGCSSGGKSYLGQGKCPYNYDVTYYGTGASSTGNIYGIYDLAGGSWDCVMAFVDNKKLGGYAGKLPSDTDYYDLYKAGNMYEYTRGKIGDATKEVLDPNNQNSSWNNDHAFLATKEFPWIKRGGTFRGGGTAGLFSYGITDALPRGDKTFRVILSQK